MAARKNIINDFFSRYPLVLERRLLSLRGLPLGKPILCLHLNPTVLLFVEDADVWLVACHHPTEQEGTRREALSLKLVACECQCALQRSLLLSVEHDEDFGLLTVNHKEALVLSEGETFAVVHVLQPAALLAYGEFLLFVEVAALPLHHDGHDLKRLIVFWCSLIATSIVNSPAIRPQHLLEDIAAPFANFLNDASDVGHVVQQVSVDRSRNPLKHFLSSRVFALKCQQPSLFYLANCLRRGVFDFPLLVHMKLV